MEKYLALTVKETTRGHRVPTRFNPRGVWVEVFVSDLVTLGQAHAIADFMRTADGFRGRVGQRGIRDTITVSEVVAPANGRRIVEIIRAAKLAIGCQVCRFRAHGSALQWAHLDGLAPARTRTGARIMPADMIKVGPSGRTRYGVRAIAEEIRRCRVLCANCHSRETWEQAH
jgi:hypothetical protein